jgi:hypothetical protein
VIFLQIKERVYGFDILRLISFIAISLHHFNSKIWYSHEFSPFVGDSRIWQSLEVFARSISFSGITVLFFTSFLISATSELHEKVLKIIPFALFAWVISSLTDFQENPYFLTWDIFPLIAIGLGICWLSYYFSRKSKWWLPAVGLIISQLPFWKNPYLNSLSLYPRHALIGDCSKDLADWPLLPWVGIILFGYGLGFLSKVFSAEIKCFQKYEIPVWIFLLGWTPLFWGAYYNITLGDKFTCEVERKDFPILLSHLLPFIFLMRISLLAASQNLLKRSSTVQWLQGLEVSQKFGFAYLIHFAIIDIVAVLLKEKMNTSSLLALTATLMILPMTEILLRLFKNISWGFLKR